MGEATLEIVGVDIADGLKRLRGNEKMYRKLLGILTKNAEDEIARFQTLPTEDKREGVRGAAHKLKGAAANLSATALFQAAEKLEQAARDAAPFPTVLDAVAEYVAVCRQFIDGAKQAGV
ncbi:hypothetical protein AGMMS49959_04970 [Planctomycetales bacterium]|nr:hypothetical protein AGMMS49959_04970 [Planctomycetales bacterium]